MSTRANKSEARREAFLRSLKRVGQKNSELRAAWLKARRDGCTDLNLVTFLFAYSVGEELVIEPRRKNRKRVLARLAASAQRLESAAIDVEQLLNHRWWKEETVSELLSSLHVEMESENAAVIQNGIESRAVSGAFRVKGRLRPDFILQLPQTLRFASQALHWLRRGLSKEKGWDERTVGRTIYLAHLVLYWQAVSRESPAWKHIAALVEGARIAAGSRGRFPTETALRLNFQNFKKRNPVLYRDLESSLAEYLQSRDPRVSFYTWTQQRKQTA